ncbi:MAG: MalY/PatB family protein [Fusicatenibacter sp.]
MQFDFHTVVFRGPENLKRKLTPPGIDRKGYVSFAGAEMDFPTAPSVIREIKMAAENGLFGYTLADETYRECICRWMETQRGMRIHPEWIVPMHGTIYSVAFLIRLVCAPGDAIITMPPVYYRYEQAAARQERRTVHCPLIERPNGYVIDFELLEKLMSEPANRLLVLCNPHNPVGRVFTKQELEWIAALSERYGVYVISDEIFAEITFDDRNTMPYIGIEQGRAYGMSVISLGKAFNLTGVNQANLIIPDDDLRRRVEKRRDADHFGSIDPFFYAAQKGAYSSEGALWLEALRQHLDQNRHFLMQLAEEKNCPFTLFPVEGTFVAWMKWQIKGQNGRLLAGEALRAYLVEELLLDLEQGAEYGEGYEAYTRMNLAATAEQFGAACERIRACFEK